MFGVSIDTSKAVARLAKMPPDIRDALAVAVTIDTGEVLGRAESLADGDVVQVRTGKFLKSIRSGVRVSDHSVVGNVHSGAPQAGIFEFGGPIPAHDIAPKSAQVLAFQAGGKTVFAGRVHHPAVYFARTSLPGGGTAGKFSVMWQAYRELQGQIKDDLVNAVNHGLAGV